MEARGRPLSKSAAGRRGKSSELAFVPDSPAGKGEPGHFGKPGLDVEDETCHPQPENLVL